jgi:hypothetical protein
VLVPLVLASSSIACRTDALVAGLSCSTRSRQPWELVYWSLRHNVPRLLQSDHEHWFSSPIELSFVSTKRSGIQPSWVSIRVKDSEIKDFIFFWVLGKMYYREGHIKKVWWEAKVLFLSKSSAWLASRKPHQTCLVVAPGLPGRPDMSGLWPASRGFHPASRGVSPDLSSLDRLPESFTGLVQWKLSQRLFWVGCYKYTPS